MDTDHTPTRHATAQQGGTVEPANRAAVAIVRYQTPDPLPGERYELRDPFAEVTYRTGDLAQILAKAGKIGSQRFIAVGEDGRRTTIEQIDGEWRRGPQRAPLPERPLDPLPARDDWPDVATTTAHADTTVDLDAERAAHTAALERALRERYLIKQAPVTLGDMTVGHTEYRYLGDTARVAFTESTFRLATDTNSPSVARSMVDVAQARQWPGIRVAGSDEFRRLVWLEASIRGVKALGHEPSLEDQELLKREREARQTNRIEPLRDGPADSPTAGADKTSARGGGGRKAVLAAIEAVLVARRVPEKQRQAIMAAATENLAQRIRDGLPTQVKVYDQSAPSRRAAVPPVHEQQRSRDRPTPAQTR